MQSSNEINNETKGLQAFFYEGNQVRTIQIDGETWWVLKDVCDVLGLSNPTHVAARLDEDERSTFNVGRQGEVNIVNESGLYRVIMRSNKSEARKFRRWVTHEVLPQIRKTGAYSIHKLSAEDRLRDLLNLDGDVVIAYGQKLKQAAELQTKVLQLENKIETDKPKIVFANAVSLAKTNVLVGELAKILKGNGIKIGQNRLFERLRQDGFLVKRGSSDYNLPTQKSMELGLFKIQETAITHSDGHITISKTVKVTGKGQQYFVNYFLNKESNSCEDDSHFIEADYDI
jgi:anti-repressor protein